MFRVTELPKPPYRSFSAYQKEMVERSRPHYKTGLKARCPCPRCDGYGKHYRDEDRDPYEGWKMASMYPCERCGGSGDIGKIALRAEFDQIMKRHQERYNHLKPRHDAEVAALAKAKKHLTTAELRTLELIPERKRNVRS